MYLDDIFESGSEDKIASIKRKLRLMVDNDVNLVKLLLKNNNYELNYIELAKPEELVDMLFDVIKSNNNIMENLRQWFKEKWVRFGPDGKIRGDCARGDDSEGKPKCLPQSKAHSLGKKGRASAASRKRREDPNPERSGPAINVATKKKSVNEFAPTPDRGDDSGQPRWLVTYDIYGTNRDKPLYTSSKKIYANSAKEAIELCKKFFGGRNFRAIQINEELNVAEEAQPQFVAARYIDEFADGEYWYVKGTPQVIQRFVQLANSLEDESVKGTEYEPGKGMMANIHSKLGNDNIPQWQIVQAQNLEAIKPIGNRVLQLLMQPDLTYGAQEFMSEFLWTLEEKGLALVTTEPEQGVAEGFLNEGLAHPVIVVDVQPEYSGMNDGNESSVFPQIINFVNKQTGPVLMFVNAEDQGMSGDTIQDIKQYWDDTICPEEERYTYDEETDDYIENPNCPKINWQRFAIADKGYGYFRSWMDHGIEPATIVATIRELYQQKKSDSRELQFPAFNRRTPQQSLIMGAMQEMGDDPISVDWTSVSQLKRFNGAYIVGGARDQCLREVELLMNAFNIKYKRIDSLIYEGKQGVAESFTDDLDNIYAMHPQPEKSEQVVFLITGMTEYEFSNRWTDLPDPYQQEFGYDLPLWDADDLISYPNLAVKRITFDQYVQLVGNYIKSEELAGSTMSRMKKGMTEGKHSCPECGGRLVEFSQLNEKKDACYYKVKSSYKVWPSAYASGALVKCRNKGAKNWGNKSESIGENKIYFAIPKSLENEQELTESFKFKKDHYGWYLKEGQENFKKTYSNALKAFTIIK